MVEFGEQLRKAREAKGMTQQTLADHLFVTRQAVSRWECGTRYPDLITAKKLAAFLEVSMDTLLSDTEMEKAVERSSVIEQPGTKKIILVLYAWVTFSLILTIVDIVLRFPKATGAVHINDLQYLSINLVGLTTQTLIFVYGFIQTMKDSLIPKKTGMIIMVFFLSVCMTNTQRIAGNIVTKAMLLQTFCIILPFCLGACGAYKFFCYNNSSDIWIKIIYLISGWGIFLQLYNAYVWMRYASEFMSMNMTVNLLLKICIYLLIIYQSYTLWRKRRSVSSEKIVEQI